MLSPNIYTGLLNKCNQRFSPCCETLAPPKCQLDYRVIFCFAAVFVSPSWQVCSFSLSLWFSLVYLGNDGLHSSFTGADREYKWPEYPNLFCNTFAKPYWLKLKVCTSVSSCLIWNPPWWWCPNHKNCAFVQKHGELQRSKLNHINLRLNFWHI